LHSSQQATTTAADIPKATSALHVSNDDSGENSGDSGEDDSKDYSTNRSSRSSPQATNTAADILKATSALHVGKDDSEEDSGDNSEDDSKDYSTSSSDDVNHDNFEQEKSLAPGSSIGTYNNISTILRLTENR